MFVLCNGVPRAPFLPRKKDLLLYLVYSSARIDLKLGQSPVGGLSLKGQY